MNKKGNTQKALNLWAVILIIWSIYRANLKLPEWFDEFIAKPLVFIAPVYFYLLKNEKVKFFEGINLKAKSIGQELLTGFGIGTVFFMTVFFASFIKSHKLAFIKAEPKLIVYFILVSLATAISEEILSRGFVLKRLYNESRNILSSSFYASFLFVFLHIPSLFTTSKLSGYMILFIILTDMGLSLISSFIFLERKNLLAPILVHALYNLTIYLFV